MDKSINQSIVYPINSENQVKVVATVPAEIHYTDGTNISQLQSISQILSNKKNITNKILKPCVPALDLQCSHDQSKQYIQIQGILRIVGNDDNGMIGYQSGKRSVLVKQDGRMVRYKGTGMEGKGFVLQTEDIDNHQYQAVYGQNYLENCLRELYITSKLQSILDGYGFITGNKSVGYFRFDQQQIVELGMECQAIHDQKYCCVMETFGERRLGTHLFQGLQINLFKLLEVIDQQQQQQYIFDNLYDQFVKQGRIDESMKIKELVVDKYSPKINFEIDLVDYLEQNKQYYHERQSKIEYHDIKQFLEKECLQQQYQQLEVFERLFRFIGQQVGCIMKIMIKNGFNWGYFCDHNEYMPHCNAHANNFVIIAGPQLLAPLDFDMAFFRSEYIDNQQNHQYDPQQFNSFMIQMKYSFEESLLGYENMKNFNYGQQEQADSLIQKIGKLVLESMRDSMFSNYEDSFDSLNQNIKLDQEIVELVEQCLAVTQNHQN